MQATLDVTLDTEREYEIVNGIPEEKPMAGARHGNVIARLIIKLGNYIEARDLGELYSPDTTFMIGRNQRLPDIGFVFANRIPEEGQPSGMWEIPPDLAVEVISPNDVYVKVTRKVDEYLEAGVKQVWLVAPERKSITIYRSPFDVTVFQDDMELVSEDLFPGFRCPLSEIFRTRKPS
jgi:Uma2 family endonuclease